MDSTFMNKTTLLNQMSSNKLLASGTLKNDNLLRSSPFFSNDYLL